MIYGDGGHQMMGVKKVKWVQPGKMQAHKFLVALYMYVSILS